MSGTSGQGGGEAGEGGEAGAAGEGGAAGVGGEGGQGGEAGSDGGECAVDADCEGSPFGPRCVLWEGLQVCGCEDASDCVGHPSGPVCNPGALLCEEAGGQGGSAGDGGAGGEAGMGGEGGGEPGGAAGAGGAPGAGMGGAGGSGQAGSGGSAGSGGGAPVCRVTICLNGAYVGDPMNGGNGWFDSVCAAAPGILEHCKSNGKCYHSFEWIGGTGQAEDALVEALDKNKDGVVDAKDPPCHILVGGYSWGGVNARNFAEDLQKDKRYAPERRRVHRMVVIDPYQPTVGKLDIPPNVDAFWEFRHTVAPPNDCSSSSPLGPYKGLVPRCKEGKFCRDYDYSLSGGATFPTYSGKPKSYLGKQIDHCNITDVAGPAMLSLMVDKSYSPAPKSVPVATY